MGRLINTFNMEGSIPFHDFINNVKNIETDIISYFLGFDYDHPSIYQNHQHNYFEFMLIRSGKVLIVTDRNILQPQFGDFIIMPPGIEHHTVVQENPYERYIIGCSPKPILNVIQNKNLSDTSFDFLKTPCVIHSANFFYYFENLVERISNLKKSQNSASETESVINEN